MQIVRSDEFKAAYRRLTKDEQKQVAAKLGLFVSNPRYPSLQAKRWRGNQWYFRVTSSIRLYYRMHAGERCELITVGHHDIERSR